MHQTKSSNIKVGLNMMKKAATRSAYQGIGMRSTHMTLAAATTGSTNNFGSKHKDSASSNMFSSTFRGGKNSLRDNFRHDSLSRTMRLNNDSALRVPADTTSAAHSRDVSLKKLKPRFGQTSKINQESRTSDVKDGANQGSHQTSKK
jgi:hypothetical protein